MLSVSSPECLHNGAVFGILWLFDQGAVKFANSTFGQRLTEPLLGILHARGDNHIINGRHQVMKVFHLGVGVVVLQGYVNVIGYLAGFFILVGADSKMTVEAGGLEVEFLLARAVGDRKEFAALGVAAGGLKGDEIGVEV
ncbi:hypothetical protein NADE_000849 [Nannochloris sp. 'desiccata']|nr:hypothetical protein NADE_000849 [Chlorella desiccata (nom. nud.)]